MPRYALTCIDKPDALALRIATREAHLAYVRGHPDLVRAAGALLGPGGEPAGSLFLIDAPDEARVLAFHHADPFTRAGLFDRAEVREWRQSVGAPI